MPYRVESESVAKVNLWQDQGCEPLYLRLITFLLIHAMIF